MSQYRKGFVLSMWTGLFPLNRWGRPVIYRTAASALRVLNRYPSWGRSAVSVVSVRTRPGSNGLPDYILGDTA